MAPSIRDFFDKAPEKDRPDVGEAETSANFDIEEVQPFLERLHAFSVPLGRLDFIAETIAELPHNYTHTFECVGVCDDKLALISITAFIDDIDAPDLTFTGPQPVIDAIDKALAEREDRARQSST